MLDHFLSSICPGTAKSIEPSLSIRETNWGYIIRSRRAASPAIVPNRMLCTLPATMFIAVAAFSFAPLELPQLWLGLLKGIGVGVGIATAAYVMLRRGRSEILELHVNTSTRELRTAIRSSGDELAYQRRTPFDHVSKSFFQRDPNDTGDKILCLDIKGHLDLLQVAHGDEPTLLAVYDRLMLDLRPIEERLPGYSAQPNAALEQAKERFPLLGPNEIAA